MFSLVFSLFAFPKVEVLVDAAGDCLGRMLKEAALSSPPPPIISSGCRRGHRLPETAGLWRAKPGWIM